ncbi:hypothetical protein STPH1_7747 [Streptomyces sp. OM5714]|nr:hypothetical protein STPH1_7747 [Streptomyces sp. OM5714]
MTAVATSVFTAAQFNQFVRDNLNETAPAKATQEGSIFVGAGANSIVERSIESSLISTSESTTSTSYTDLATTGPAVTVDTSSRAIVFVTANLQNDTAMENVYASYEVSGDTSIGATDSRGAFMGAAYTNQVLRAGQIYLEDTLTPGSNTFTMKYRVTGGTGKFTHRHLVVIPL